MVLLFCDIVRV
ncbi:Protein of unknown function [Thermobacillus xylanilyticus]|uniref:Uncharacterized protein n=1 Tax=Thermobacillus xylanilyticus TaxID=76633 RepID=A0ABN7RTJ7_THEXY|nr:Protein of unknown function [Thermobacillus xylanilyticus]